MNRIALLCGLVLAATVGSAAAQASGTIAYIFIPGPPGNTFGIFTMDANGENPSRMPLPGTSSPGKNADYNISWSSDGTQATLGMRDPDTNALDIFVINDDGTHSVNLTNDRAVDKNPTFSADGTQIAFESFRDGGVDIYVMGVDGGALTQLTDHEALDRSPAWSPDGTRIAFISRRDGNDELYVMNADGSNPVRLTDSEGDENFPDWSPDGQRIAFGVDQRTICVIGADGGDLVHLTDDTAWRESPSWSPDGSKIAFSSDGVLASGKIDIYTMDADGGNLVNLTNNTGRALSRFPSWAPVGGVSAATLIEAISWGRVKAKFD